MSRHFNLRRRKETREPKPRFIIFSEGLNTEPDYIRELVKLNDEKIVIDIKPASGPAKTIAAKAIQYVRDDRSRKKRDSYEKHDQIWVFFDDDGERKIKESIDNCSRNNIGVAYSNPCFELWLILHFEDYDRSENSSIKVQKKLESICPEYSLRTGKRLIGSNLINNLQDATRRAQEMRRRRSEERAEFCAPWTTVDKFTDAVSEAIRKVRGK